MLGRLSTKPQGGQFRYCVDPVFVATAVLYAVNRLYLKPICHFHFAICYANSLFCIPFCLPPVLYAYSVVGLRETHAFPSRFELVLHLAVWSLFFKWLAPTVIKGPFSWVIGDPWDVFWYAVGTVIAGFFWHSWSRSVSEGASVYCRQLGTET